MWYFPPVQANSGSDAEVAPRPNLSAGRRLPIAAGLLRVAFALLAACDGVHGPRAFKIYVVDPGVYRVTYEELKAAGLAAGSVRSRDLALTHRGAPVPIWVADGGDGRFGPGDRIELVGERLQGHRSYYNEHSVLNVYRLTTGGTEGLRMTVPALPPAAARPAEPAHLEVEDHWEENNFLVHLPGQGEDAEPHFWTRLSHIDEEPFRREGIWLGRSRAGSRPLSLRVQLSGWSIAGHSRGRELADHRVEVFFNGAMVGAGEWDGRKLHVIDVAVPDELVRREAANVLEIKVPRRRPSPSEDALIDAVALDWIRIRLPAPEAESTLGGAWIPEVAQRLILPAPRSLAKVRLASTPGADLVVYGHGGSRYDSRNMELEDHEGSTLHHFYLPPEESVIDAVPDGALLAPVAVELDRPSGLKDPGRQADYVIIAHPRLLEAIAPLADFHRRRGLAVTVVAVDDVYDDFNHGILHPDAIRDVLSYAYHRWRRPAPRFVLLVGDASWNAERTGATYEGGAPYATDGELTHRDLIPTSIYEGPGGQAASDNFFVAVDGDDHLPDMAIGRFPVAEPEEVAAIVDKIQRYSEEVGVGPWRRRILWLADESSWMQARSDLIAGAVDGRGFASLKLYPSSGKPSDEQTQTPLLEAFDAGQLLVHFFGHGARHVWRTGASDHRERFDLFGLEHLPRLQPTARLPLVLSMTCWSAPFDHPTADSIGEKFLRLEGRGAIAFLGASWKVSPSKTFSDLLIEGLTSPGTIGEAVQRAKRGIENRNLVASYNLLGDPAIELALPRHALEIAVRGGGGEAWRIVASVPETGFSGRAIVDWLDDAGEVVSSERLEVHGATFETEYRPAAAAGVVSVRVYVWDRASEVDGMGMTDLDH